MRALGFLVLLFVSSASYAIPVTMLFEGATSSVCGVAAEPPCVNGELVFSGYYSFDSETGRGRESPFGLVVNYGGLIAKGGLETGVDALNDGMTAWGTLNDADAVDFYRVWGAVMYFEMTDLSGTAFEGPVTPGVVPDVSRFNVGEGMNGFWFWLPGRPGIHLAPHEIDRFSIKQSAKFIPVPEPGTLGLLGVALLWLFRRTFLPMNWTRRG